MPVYGFLQRVTSWYRSDSSCVEDMYTFTIFDDTSHLVHTFKTSNCICSFRCRIQTKYYSVTWMILWYQIFHQNKLQLFWFFWRSQCSSKWVIKIMSYLKNHGSCLLVQFSITGSHCTSARSIVTECSLLCFLTEDFLTRVWAQVLNFEIRNCRGKLNSFFLR